MEGNFLHERQVIPVPLCRWVYRQRLTNPFADLVLLKMLTKGAVTHSEAIRLITEDSLLGRSEKTARTHLRSLSEGRFVRPLGKGTCRRYILSGYNWLYQHLDLRGKVGVEFYPEYFQNFRSFVAGAVIGYSSDRFSRLLNRLPKGRRSGAALIAGRNSTGFPAFIEGGLSTSLIAEELNVSYGYAQKLKVECADNGFITVSNQYVPAYLSDYSVDKATLIRFQNLTLYGQALKIRNGEYVEQVHDRIIPCLDYRTQKPKR